ncbi:MAG: hypothetical protein DMF56_24330 [Acidobacteria bacterium]|nr:MAG: hypothetical protein DMF56_24330 [Acidobacteriota bacterium]
MKKKRRALVSLTCQPSITTDSYGSSTHFDAFQPSLCFASIVLSPSTDNATATRYGIGLLICSEYSRPCSASMYVVPRAK